MTEQEALLVLIEHELKSGAVNPKVVEALEVIQRALEDYLNLKKEMGEG